MLCPYHDRDVAAADDHTAAGSMSRSMSSTGNTAWVGCINMVSIIGYFVLSGAANSLITGSYDLGLYYGGGAHVHVGSHPN
jgi:hypothetical protein